MKDDRSHSDATVLVVEDEPGLAQLYSMWLSEFYQVRTAYSATEALEQFDDSVDVILVDRRMPGRSGDELIAHIRAHDYDVKIAVVSGVEPEIEIADMAIDEYLTKPVNRERVETAVDELLLRSEKGATQQQLLSLVSRKMVLEERYRQDELEESTEYQRLLERIEDLTGDEPVSIHRISSKFRPKACPECDLRWDVTVDGTVGFLGLGSHVWKCAECGHVVHYTDPFDRRVARR